MASDNVLPRYDLTPALLMPRRCLKQLDVKEMVDVEEALGYKRKVIGDQGGVMGDKSEWYGIEMENTLALSEDEPKLREA